MNYKSNIKTNGYKIVFEITGLSILLAVFLYALLSLMSGKPPLQGIIKAMVIPIIIAPLMCRRLFATLARLSLAEEALLQNEIKFKSIVENSHDGIFIVDDRYRFVYANAEFIKILGYPLAEIIGRDFRVFLEDESHKVVSENYIRRQRGETAPTQYEFSIVRKNGEVRRVTLRSVVGHDLKKGTHTYGQILDITETRMAEKDLRESEKRYRDVFENTGTATVIIEKDKYLSMVNTEFEKLSGYTKEEIEGKMRWTDFVSAEDLQKMNEYHTARRKGSSAVPKEYEFQFIDRSGNTRQILNKVTLISGTDESVAALLDITNIVKAKNDLVESENKFRSITASAKDAIIMIDGSGMVTYWNKAAGQMFGFTAGDILGKELHKMLAPAGILPTYRSVASEFRKTGHGPIVGKTFELTGLNKDRVEFPIELSVSALKLNGEWNAIGIVRDISERKRLEGELQQAHKMEAIGTLAGGIAHDFNNILGAIIGYTELAIIDTPDKSRMKSNLHGALKGASRAKDLVKQILTFSRQGAQEKRPLYVGPIVKETLGLLRASLPATIDIRQHLEPESGTVEANPTQLHQVLMNLCTNAAHAMHSTGGILTVKVENMAARSEQNHDHSAIASNPHLKLTVSDTGHGISHDIAGRIFEPYFTTKERGEGTGLGLSVVHGIIKSYGGTIDVSSIPGKGTVFQIRLPFTEQKTRQKNDFDKPLPTGKGHVLVVDDEQDLVEIAGQMLTRLGYTVSTTANSIEALKFFESHPEDYDLVVTDMTMPDMTGADLTNALKRIRPDIPVILCSGFNEQISREKLMEMGISAFVMKPIKMREMADTISQVLNEAAC